jgi:hypothetical protein
MEELEASSNPFAVIVAAHLTNQQTRRNQAQRYAGKLFLAKSLYQRGYDIAVFR